jgi:hypothetical protein
MYSIVDEACIELEHKIKSSEIDLIQIGNYFKWKIKEKLK